MITNDQIEQLIAAAAAAREHAFARFSGRHVGAAVLTDQGEIISGANCEQSTIRSYCAERVALCTAFAAGNRSVSALAVVSQEGVTPCGACRQAIYDFCGNITVIVARVDGSYICYQLDQLLPNPYSVHISCGC